MIAIVYYTWLLNVDLNEVCIFIIANPEVPMQVVNEKFFLGYIPPDEVEDLRFMAYSMLKNGRIYPLSIFKYDNVLKGQYHDLIDFDKLRKYEEVKKLWKECDNLIDFINDIDDWI